MISDLVMLLTALCPVLRATERPWPPDCKLTKTVALRKGDLAAAWKVRGEQWSPWEPSGRLQDPEESSRRVNSTEEHWASGWHEEKDAWMLFPRPELAESWPET